MKIKTDLYTKIVLTVIAVALVGHLAKDIDFVTKANASELDLSALKVEDASNAGETTFYIYENDNIFGGFGKDKYIDRDFHMSNPSTSYKGGKPDNKLIKAHINSYYDIPKYIITTKTGSFWLER